MQISKLKEKLKKIHEEQTNSEMVAKASRNIYYDELTDLTELCEKVQDNIKRCEAKEAHAKFSFACISSLLTELEKDTLFFSSNENLFLELFRLLENSSWICNQWMYSFNEKIKVLREKNKNKENSDE